MRYWAVVWFLIAWFLLQWHPQGDAAVPGVRYDPSLQQITRDALIAAIRARPLDEMGNWDLISRAAESGVLEDAVDEYKKQLSLDPHNVVLSCEFEHACLCAHGLRPGYVPKDHARWMSQLSQFFNSRDVLESVVNRQLDPSWWFALLCKGAYDIDQEDPDAGIECIRRAEKMQPRCATIHEWLAWGYLGRGAGDDAVKALVEARTCIALDKMKSGGYFAEAGALIASGQAREAIVSYKEALALYPPETAIPKESAKVLDFFRKAAQRERPRKVRLQGDSSEIGRAGQPGPTRPAPPIGFVYTANQGSNSVSELRIAPDGSLTPLQPPSIPTGAAPRGVAVDPAGRFCYVSNWEDSTISQFKITDSGVLSPLVIRTVVAGQKVVFLAMHPSGKVLYALNDGDNSISQYYLAHDGRLKPLFPPTVATGAGPEFMGFDPEGRHAYVANHDAGSISQYIVKTDGRLVPLVASYPLKGKAPESVIVDGSGRFAYVLSKEGKAILTLHVDADGKLGSEVAPETSMWGSPDAMAMAPSGRYLYVVGSSGDLYQYSISAAGQLSPLARQDAQMSGGTLAICITPDGRFVYGANNALGNVIQYMVRSDGSLELLWPQTTPIGKYANGITVAWRGAPGGAAESGKKGIAPSHQR